MLNTDRQNYRPAEQSLWKGRQSGSGIDDRYWYQTIEFHDPRSIKKNCIDVGVLGYACDEGVKRNFGRAGAQRGPDALRQCLAKLPVHVDNKRVADLGNIICLDGHMEACQELFAHTVSLLISSSVFPVGIGGGHDMAYAHFTGIRKALSGKPNNRVGIVNFDAHFDMRPLEGRGSSGTPFHQIIRDLKKENETLHYFALGIQRQSNTKELFAIAKAENVEYATDSDCHAYGEPTAIQERLKSFSEKNDYLYITIDMDGFSSAYAPGVSAPSPLGFSPRFVFTMLDFLFKTKKVIACDIAELNPNFDRDNATANLAARIVDFVVMKQKSIF